MLARILGSARCGLFQLVIVGVRGAVRYQRLGWFLAGVRNGAWPDLFLPMLAGVCDAWLGLNACSGFGHGLVALVGLSMRRLCGLLCIVFGAFPLGNVVLSGMTGCRAPRQCDQILRLRPEPRLDARIGACLRVWQTFVDLQQNFLNELVFVGCAHSLDVLIRRMRSSDHLLAHGQLPLPALDAEILHTAALEFDLGTTPRTIGPAWSGDAEQVAAPA